MNNDLMNVTVSHGTHRPEDLIPAFLEVLKTKDRKQYDWRMLEIAETSLEEECSFYESGSIPNFITCLFDDLESISPNNYYFGAHPGDGSDFGFWEVESD